MNDPLSYVDIYTYFNIFFQLSLLGNHLLFLSSNGFKLPNLNQCGF